MAMFGLQTDKDRKVMDFQLEASSRLRNNNLLYNPFIGKIKAFRFKDDHIILLFDITPIYPNVSYIGWLILSAMLFLIQSISLWMLIPIAIILTDIFWSPYFYCL